MVFHSTDFQGSAIDALRERIAQRTCNSRVAVNGGGEHFGIEIRPPVHAVDNLKPQTSAGHEPGVASHRWPRAIEIQLTTGVPT